MSDGKRKHVATGNRPPGGERGGAGRPVGSTNALPLGTVSAVKSLRLRVPDGTPEEVAKYADEAFQKMVAVMREEVSPFSASGVLKAATAVRLEICGPVAQKLEHSGALSVDIQINRTVKK